MKILYLLIATLKFLGIAVLILLLLLLLVVIIILAVPIKYSVYMEKSEAIYIYTRVKWLYSIVGMDIIYNSGNEITKKFKLFGIVVSPRKSKKLKSKIVKESKDYNTTDTISKQKKEETIKNKKISIKEGQEDTSTRTKTKTKIKKSKEKKGSLKETIAQIQSFGYKRELIADTISWGGKLLKSISPSTLHMEIEIGKEDPADTGQLIAAVSALYPLYYTFMSIVGNYEKECFYGKLETNGDITLGRFIYDLIKYIRMESVKQFIKFARENRKGKKHGRKATK
ncbi:MAG TPA: DUF2953 domain-containing protein [Epulopiscium sp.]|nr:DUF2953 domain-containing protein [Candidatus Epulonipiscium sp.]